MKHDLTHLHLEYVVYFAYTTNGVICPVETGSIKVLRIKAPDFLLFIHSSQVLSTKAEVV